MEIPQHYCEWGKHYDFTICDFVFIIPRGFGMGIGHRGFTWEFPKW